MARSRGSGRVRYRLQISTYGSNSYSTIITIGPSITGLRGTQLTGSINYTLVTWLFMFLGFTINLHASFRKLNYTRTQRGLPRPWWIVTARRQRTDLPPSATSASAGCRSGILSSSSPRPPQSRTQLLPGQARGGSVLLALFVGSLLSCRSLFSGLLLSREV
jgi:hypothetical protein